MEIILYGTVVFSIEHLVHFHIVHRILLVDTIHVRKCCEILRGLTTPAYPNRDSIENRAIAGPEKFCISAT